ncbi:MAG: iron-containing alcohol dehydrogenase [Turneriella sp.]|nr:iron-containing alcohol dehydrogenase [Turneriella sp.]
MQGIGWAQFFLPTRIQFESDSTFKIGSYVKQFGSRILLLTLKSENKNPAELNILKNGLTKHSEGVILYDDLAESPNSDQVDSVAYFAKKAHADLIVAFGSTETFALAKFVSILLTNSVFAADVLGGRVKLQNPPIPLVTVPVEPALGEELSPAFTIRDAADGNKKYFAHELLFPVATFYDPKVCEHLTSDSIARIGGATLGFAIESLLSPKANPLSSALALRAIEMLRRNIPQLYKDAKNEKLLSTLLWNSAMVSVATVSSPVGVAFAVANALNAYAQTNFCDALSLILPHVMEYYLTAAPAQFINIARALGEDVRDISVIEAAIKAVEGVRRLFLEINLPTRLSEFDVKKHELEEISRLAMVFPHLENAPRQLTRNEIESILLAAY